MSANDVPLQQSPFSSPFNTLYYLGAWASKPLGPRKLLFYFFYQVGVTFLSFCGILSLLFDLYLVSDSFEKVTWNLCVTTFFAGGVVKNINLYTNHRTMRGLRRQLHEDVKSRTDEDLDRKAVRQFRVIRISFYCVIIMFTPFWVAGRYHMSTIREPVFPVPVRLPVIINLEDEVSFNYTFGIVTLGAILGLVFVVETEMVMQSFLVQISREYDILLKDIGKFDALYRGSEGVWASEEGRAPKKLDMFMKKLQAQRMVMMFASRQRKIVGYTKDFEKCYSKIMLLEIFVVSVLMLVSAIQCLLMSETSFYDLSYQMGYLAAIIFHYFFTCWFANKISDQCCDVGVALYSTNWYLMDVNTQRAIMLIIVRAQNPPRLTAGRAIDLNVNAFMNVMKNIYSWVTLFRQLELR